MPYLGLLSTGKWDKKRFDQIVDGLTPFLKQCGYNMKKEVTFLPVAALYGHNIKDPVPKEMCDWYEGGTLFEVRQRLTGRTALALSCLTVTLRA